MNRSASLPAAYGAMPPPMNRTNPYVAEATGRSTGETIITAWVTSVLLMPRKTPATITATMTTTRLVVDMAIRARSRASSTKFTYRVRAVPKRACSRGAPNTEKTATSTPQPQNTSPSWIASRPMRNGENASRVKNPQL